MNTGNVKISPVDIEERKKLGIKPGDTVRVWQKIEEKGKTRLQAFEGVVLAVKHGTEPGATFTVRKVSLGVGVEKIFPLYSPNIDKIEIIRRAKVRRAKLYFIRDKVSKELRRIFRKAEDVYLATKGAAELEEERRKMEEELKKKEAEELLAKEEAESAAQDTQSASESDTSDAAEETKEEASTDNTENDNTENKDVEEKTESSEEKSN